MTRAFHRSWLTAAGALLLQLAMPCAAGVGLIELRAEQLWGPVTLLYPSSEPEANVMRGPFRFEAAVDATVVPGNGHLVVLSHGSSAPVWLYLDLARTLVDAGYVVVMPSHLHDTFGDSGEPGPPSWKRRPFEVSNAIDRVSLDDRFAGHIDFDAVGVFGMSAGGHAALTLAGGRWSPSLLSKHCKEFIGDDFHACAGPSVSLTGGALDGIKKFIVRQIDRWKFDDDTYYQHTDPRISAIIAGVPFAADFDFDSLRSPPVPLGLIAARRDAWLNPRFHSDAVMAACRSCELILDLENGGHGALLSPLPPSASRPLIADPPGFDRAREIPLINATIVAFFDRHLRRVP